MSEQISDNSQGDTGTHDITYDLVSVIYHSLKGAETTAMFIADAEQEKCDECVEFLRETKEEYIRRANRAKELLTKHVGASQSRGATGGNS
jgi:arginine utilization protein RocB